MGGFFMEKINFNTKEAVEYLLSCGLHFKQSTLEVWRSYGKGPRYKKVAGKIYYEKSDLNEFISGKKVETIDSVDNKRNSKGQCRTLRK